MVVKVKFVITIECTESNKTAIRDWISANIKSRCETWKSSGIITRAGGAVSEYEEPETWDVT